MVHPTAAATRFQCVRVGGFAYHSLSRKHKAISMDYKFSIIPLMEKARSCSPGRRFDHHPTRRPDSGMSLKAVTDMNGKQYA